MITIIGNKGKIEISAGNGAEEIYKQVEWDECRNIIIKAIEWVEPKRDAKDVFACIEKYLKNMQSFYYETKMGNIYMKSYTYSLVEILVH